MCTRFVWSSAGEPGAGLVLVGRSMDWFEPTNTVVALRPRGVERVSAEGDAAPFSWTSRYGSVVALMYGQIPVDGINEKGFQVSGLYLSESDYGERDTSRPGLALEQAIQSFLDRFATVEDAVDWIEASEVQILPFDIGGKPGTGHIAFADRSGDTAIVEFIGGLPRIYHGPQYTVMANSPVYEEQLVLQHRYSGLGGNDPLPGGTNSPDRFARAAYYSAMLPPTDSPREAAAQVFSVIRNASAPFGTVDKDRPNVSTTRWRTVADLTSSRYFFESTTSPSVIWVDLEDISFDPGPDRVIDTEGNMMLSGDVTPR